MKVILLNGPNLNLLNSRNKEMYGNFDLKKIINLITSNFPKITFDFFQSNSENELVVKIQHAPQFYDGLIINPGGLSHSSISLRDALELCRIPKVEVHLSNISSREDFRKISITASVCDGYISGFKHISYLAAFYTISQLISEKALSNRN
ncbi:MAG: type II 3-dehydroquinate dehydratase [Bacteroidota bacterium]